MARVDAPPGSAAPVTHWLDGPLAWRDRLLASAAFRRWAQAFPLTRWLARRRAAGVFDLVAGFVYSQVLLACVQLRLFELLLDEGPQSASALAGRWQLPLMSTERLLRAAVALKLLEHRPHDRYGLGPLGAPLAGDAGLAAMIEHHAALYRDLAEPLALLRGTTRDAGLAAYWPYAGTDAPQTLPAERLKAYSDLMAASQPLVADQVLGAYPLRRHRRLLDVGGGNGAFACRAAQSAPGLQVQVFDLPGVAAAAHQRFEQAGLSDRCTAVGGDFLHDPLPVGADLVTLLRVVHDHDDARVLRLLRAVRQALVPGGSLLLAEPLAGTPGAERMGDTYFGVYLLAMGRGEPRSEQRLRELLAEAGFARVRRLPTALPLQASALLAKTPDTSNVNVG
ncbi:acetylserotonin O-methyltransferase [Roseateles amylovorans]|uniref:Acetylserotonin O-methyltransferase n=1 Tax=Roseateles amylovorans TaxID=2978473 RepID=A0ABY6AZI4_9BURK|nr:acetylserotonin O-methyltransferase [Roseateles amylovorans]UXH78584.1 acetylserotonin O-methyltransferase [Roseateles amylovorans]